MLIDRASAAGFILVALTLGFAPWSPAAAAARDSLPGPAGLSPSPSSLAGAAESSPGTDGSREAAEAKEPEAVLQGAAEDEPAGASNRIRITSAAGAANAADGADGAPRRRCSDPVFRAESLRCFPALLLDDAGTVFTAPAHWRERQWTLFSAALLGIGGVGLADASLRRDVLRGHSALSDRLASTFEPFGSWASFAVLGGFYLEGAARDDRQAELTALDGVAASVIAGGVISPALKLIVGRSRPRAGRGTHSFQPFSSGASFPSGHATQAFTVASVIATEYDRPWVQVATYLPAALVAFARMRHDAHFASDVTAGALIGISVGRAVAHHNQRLRGRLALAPLLGDHQRGAALNVSF